MQLVLDFARFPTTPSIVVMAFDRARPGQRRDHLAFDRATVRTKGADGHLHVGVTNISKANICPYVGKEIPDFEALGLEPDRLYQLYRDPEELAKAAPTFNNLPLLSKHVPVSSEDHPPELVIGSTGTDAEFVEPYLRNSLVVWPQEAIDDIESEKKKELSSAYRYTADMTPGEFGGERYDGVMRNIIGNHVALVEEGRAGTDVVVGDSMENVNMTKKAGLSRMAAFAAGALLIHLKPKLAQDAKVDLGPVFAKVTRKNFKDSKPAIVKALGLATDGKLAKDASIEDVAMLLDTLEAHPAAAIDDDPLPQKTVENIGGPEDRSMDAGGGVGEFLKGKLSEDDYASAMDMIGKGGAGDQDPKLGELGAADEDDDEEEKKRKEAEAAKEGAKDEPPPFKGKPNPGGTMDKKAMDQAIKVAVDQATKNQVAIREAEKFVRPWVGELAVACDSAEAVHRATLKALGVTGHDTVHASALATIIGMQPKPGSRQAARTADPIAQDAKDPTAFANMYPEANRVTVL